MRALFLGVSVLILVGCGANGQFADQVGETEKVERWLGEVEAMENTPTELQLETVGSLSSLVGSRLRGTPTDGSTERAADVQQWEWALGGTAILIQHALEDGSYGGDTYVYKDAATGELVYVYITNAGFRTEGVMRVNEDGSFTAEEDVSGHESITKVRSTSVINEDGPTSMTSEYLSDGEWVPGHAFTYVPTDQPLPSLTPKTPDAD